LFLKRIFSFRTIKKRIFYFKRRNLRHKLNAFFSDFNKFFDLKNVFASFFFSMYNHAFFNINPASTLVYYRRPSWH
jgi:hypothetical protein